MTEQKKVIITGGAGFIGSCLARWIYANTDYQIAVLDALTYAGDKRTLEVISTSKRFSFIQANINEYDYIKKFIVDYQPNVIFHLAAESHVDNSINGPRVFIETNIIGSFNLLESARHYWSNLGSEKKNNFRFIHVSTDEVFGSLESEGLFTEQTPYDPSSPYSASKAASDHLARAWFRTYGLPIMITNCSNNYGMYQFPEKLMPLMILRALNYEKLPVYGDGKNVRDWLFVDDHCRGLWATYKKAKPGDSFNFGGDAERSNLEVVESICDIVDEIRPGNRPRRELIEFVKDRPGHDFRYAMDAKKAKRELDWKPTVDFQGGLRKTVEWYLENESWWRKFKSS